MPDLAWWQWTLGGLCAFFVGVAKTGVPGLGVFVVPLMVFAAANARQSAGWLLPLLCVADVFAVVYYRRHAVVRRLLALVPWVVVGMVAGAAALGGSEKVLRPVVGAIVLAMVGLRLWSGRRPSETPAAAGDALQGPSAGGPSVGAPVGKRAGAAFGVVAGFATTVANAAGPVMNLYLLAQRFPKAEFIATGAWFFLVINLAKVPIYVGHGLIDGRSLLFDAVVLPALLIGVRTGRALFFCLPQRLFEAMVVGLTVVAALALLVPWR